MKRNRKEDKDELQGGDIEDVSNEEIEEYFSKALEYNDESVSALQGLAAYYISNKEYKRALPFLQKAKSLNKWNANTWIQLSRLCQTLNEEEIPNALDVLKEGMKFIENHEYAIYKRYIDNIGTMSEELIGKLILYGGDDTNNIELAEKYCWLILHKFDKLNITALRDISKVCEDRKKIELFFDGLLTELDNICNKLQSQFKHLQQDKQLFNTQLTNTNNTEYITITITI